MDDAAEIAATDATANCLRDSLDYRAATVPPAIVRRAAADRPVEAVAKTWANRPIEEVLNYGERAADDSSMTLVDAGTQFEETATALAAARELLIIHVTADGIPTGHPLVPVIWVTDDRGTAATLGEDIDVDGTAPDAATLLERTVATADGNETVAEEHGLSPFAISRTGPSL